MIVSALRLSLFVGLSLLVGCHGQQGAGSDGTAVRADACLQLEQGWVRAPMPGNTMTAAYGRLSNRCDRPVALMHLHSDLASRVELHRTEIVDGISRMRVETVPKVPAGGMLKLAPGGLHLMLHDVSEAMVDGTTLRLSLGSGPEDVLRVTLPVRRLDGSVGALLPGQQAAASGGHH